MGNNKVFDDYSIGYDPKAVEHDLQIISQLTRSMASGKKKLTMQQAQAIYYKIKNENIQFQSNTGEEFLLNLYENMTDAQIQEINRGIRRKRQRKQNRRQLVRINRKIAAAVSAVVLVSSILCINWSLLMDLRTNYQTKKLQEKVIVHSADLKADGVDVTPISDEGAALSSNESESGIAVNSESGSEILLKFTQLYSENQDFAGWLRIPGTKIDYPVMSREGDNNYYLDKNFERQHDKNGLLILDYRSSIKNNMASGGQNLIIYGHNMRTGVMFGTLKNYKDKSFCDEHMTISFDTLYEECEYSVVAAMLGSVAYEDEDVFRYYDAIDISTEENFNAFKENVMSNALYTTDESIEYGDTCLILSTCDNYKEDGRFVVIAKKI
ncbi:MAG: class B sortase [Lachnospiraceae bacterium]|nr:class B sortase [Lachnospiraceae bacterium]